MKKTIKVFAALLFVACFVATASAAPFIASVNSDVTLTVGKTTSITVMLTGPEPVTIGVPGMTDLGMQIRFNVPSCVKVLDVRPMQTYPPRQEFKWGNSGNVLFPGDHYINQNFTYLDEGVRTPPFDVQMGPLYVITVQGVSTCSGKIDLKTAYVGVQHPAASLVDGHIDVVQ